MKRTVVVALAIAVAVVVAWFAWRERAPRAADTGAPHVVEQATAIPTAPVEAASRAAELERAAGLERGAASAASEAAAPQSRPAVARRALRARVLDFRQRPLAGATVALVRREPGRATTLWKLATSAAPDGIAEVVSLDEARAERERADAPPSAGAWLLQLVATTDLDRATVLVDPWSPPDEPVLLRTGPGGPVTVVLEDPRGLPVRDPAVVTLEVDSPGRPASPEPSSWFDPSGRAHSGPFEFPHVRFGVPLVATARLEGRRHVHSARLPTPRSTAPGETIRVVVDKDRPLVAGRIVDGAGSPAAGARFASRVVATRDGRTEIENVAEIATDGAGRFQIEIDEELLAGGRRSLEIDGRTATARDPRVETASIDLSFPLPAGVHDVGDVALESRPPLVSGVVLDDDDRPVPGARLVVARQTTGTATSDPATVQWVSVARPEAMFRTDAEGRFVVGGAFAPGTHSVIAGKDASTYADEPHGFVPPAEGVRLRLHRAATIAGSIVGIDAADRREIALEARRETAPGEPWVARGSVVRTSPMPDGTFTFTGLRPGRFEVAVEFRFTEVARIHGVHARASETTRDPRLDSFDLGRFRTIELTVVDANGKAVGSATARRLDPADSNRAVRRNQGGDAEGRVKLLVDGPLDVLVGAPGFRPTTLRGVAGDARVTLTRGIPVRVTVANAEKLPDAPVSLSLVLATGDELERMRRRDRPGGQAPPGTTSIAEVPRATGVVSLGVGAAGRHAVALRARFPVEGSNERLSLLFDVAPGVLEIADLEGEQTFTVALSDDAASKAAAEIAERRGSMPK